MSPSPSSTITSMDVSPDPDHIQLLVMAGSGGMGQAITCTRESYGFEVAHKRLANVVLNYNEEVLNGDLERVNEVIPTFYNKCTLKGQGLCVLE